MISSHSHSPVGRDINAAGLKLRAAGIKPGPAAVGFLLAAILIFAGACGGPPAGRGGRPGLQEEQRERQAVPVEALTVTSGQLIRSIEASGTVAGIREALVVSETQGIVEEVRFDLGQAVEKGEVLVQVDEEIARLNMEQAREQLETARIEYTAKENLVERGGASRAELALARSSLRGAEAQYRRTVDAYENCSISSPIRGSVAGKQPAASIGNYLNPGMEIARITDLSSLRLEVSIGEGLIGLVTPGAQARVSIPAACDQEMTATVSAVAAGSDPATGSYTVALEWENACPDQVKSGMTARVAIEPRSRAPEFIIPTAALTERSSRQVVLLAEDGQVVLREIKVGRQEGNLTAVLSGLNGGETLILSGIRGLSAGDPVAPSVIGSSGEWQ